MAKLALGGRVSAFQRGRGRRSGRTEVGRSAFWPRLISATVAQSLSHSNPYTVH